MPGVLHANSALPAFPNIWPYTTERFVNADIGVKLQMCDRLVVKAKKSVFFIIANSPHDGEQVVHWEVRVSNVRKRLQQHEDTRKLVEKEMYTHCGHMNGHM